MKKTLLRKRFAVVAGLLAIFSFTGFAYAKKANKILGADKPHTADMKMEIPEITEAAQNDSVAVETDDQVMAQKEEMQPIIASQSEVEVDTNSDKKTQKEEGPDKESNSLITSIVESITEKMSPSVAKASSNYPLHKNITTTVFWAGEEAGEDNKNISNLPSAWDEEWVKHFGGVDTPNKRSGYMPSGFIPKENPFYFALPYNDFDEDGNRKKEVAKVVAWAGKRAWKDDESVLKNQWIKITKNGKVAYAQWQDVGPFKEDDVDYVFGSAAPKSKINKHAGLDVSPAVKDMLGLEDIDTTDWQFVNPDEVPDGPWKAIVTTSQIFWK